MFPTYWYRSDSGLWVTGGIVPAVNDGDPIGRWDDIEGTGANLVGAGAARPTLQNGAGDPFDDAPNGDFHLSAGTDAGTDVGSPYDTDPDGETRGADGIWDRGAYEYDNSGDPPTAPSSGWIWPRVP